MKASRLAQGLSSKNLGDDAASGARIHRRQFIARAFGSVVAATALGVAGATAKDGSTPPTKSAVNKTRIKLGVVGCGGRGAWIAKLFQQHGGFELHSLADYFPEVADRCGAKLGVNASRRFSTLSGYQKLLASGVEAVALEVPPYFFPMHARAAVAAGVHVYMAKPVAVDVPGCLEIESAAKESTKNGKCFFVDYQLPTDPANREVFQRIRTPGFGRIAELATTAFGSGFSDPAKTANLESRLQKLIWVNDVALGCDYIGNYDIHAIDAALWVAGSAPLAASGASGICRSDPHGDSHDVCSVVYEFADGLVCNHIGQALKNHNGEALNCRVYGQTGNALLSYWGKAEFRSSDDIFNGNVENLYEAGVVRNIATFHELITGGKFENVSVPRAVQSALACILGREAAALRERLTMDQILKENRRLEVDLSGLKT